MNYFKRIFNRLKKLITSQEPKYDLTGERVDITFKRNIDFDTMDIFQKSHFRRYEFAVEHIAPKEVCGDFACGTGYGSVMLSNKAQLVIGADLNNEVIAGIKKRYRKLGNIDFLQANLLDLTYNSVFDTIVSFETIEHFSEENILLLLSIFHRSLKPQGRIIFSTPFMQERNEAALQLGHHLTYYINEAKIQQWLAKAGFTIELFNYQNYETHSIKLDLHKKDFVICIAKKN